MSWRSSSPAPRNPGFDADYYHYMPQRSPRAIDASPAVFIAKSTGRGRNGMAHLVEGLRSHVDPESLKTRERGRRPIRMFAFDSMRHAV